MNWKFDFSPETRASLVISQIVKADHKAAHVFHHTGTYDLHMMGDALLSW